MTSFEHCPYYFVLEHSELEVFASTVSYPLHLAVPLGSFSLTLVELCHLRNRIEGKNKALTKLERR